MYEIKETQRVRIELLSHEQLFKEMGNSILVKVHVQQVYHFIFFFSHENA